MKKILLVAVAVLAIASVGVYFNVSAQAGSSLKSSPVSASQLADTFITVGPPHTLKKTIVNQATGLVAKGAGFAALDAPTPVTCPGTAGTCLIAADQGVQVTGAAAGRWAICSQVDGAFMNPSCPFLGVVPATGFVAGAFSQNATVGVGAHSVQTFVYTDGAASMSIYNINYRVYKP
jgi:hypothetical protein